MTVADIIQAALRKIGVVGPGMTATGNESETALEVLNTMLHGWRLDGLDFSQTVDPLLDQPDLAANDRFPLPAAFREGVIYCLASRLAPEYSLPAFDVEAFLVRMRAAVATVPTSSVDPALTWQNDATRRFFL